MTIKELRTKSGMTQKAFAEHFDIPHRTIQNWEGGQRQCPEYLLDLMQYKLENEKLISREIHIEQTAGVITITDTVKRKEEITEEEKAHKEAALWEMKQKLKAHEEWKQKHPRPKHKEGKLNK